jgi:3-hydroxyacyl-[acyl-carrier-protein] dehydratase
MRFILIDRIIHIEKEKSAKGVKNLAMTEDYFEHHFPFFPVMPGVLMLEAMVQLSRWLIAYSTEFNYFGLLAKLDSAKFRKPAQPGDVLDVRVEWLGKAKTGILFLGRIFLDGKMIAEANFENKLIEITSNEDKSLLRRNFQFVTKRIKDLIEEQGG